MKKPFGMAVVLASAALFSVASAKADVLKWTLLGAVFADGGTASGSFDYDTVTEAYTAIDITTNGGGILPGASYTIENPFTAVRDYGFDALVFPSDNAQGDFELDINTTTNFNTPGTVSIGDTTDFVSAEGACYNDGCSLIVPERFLTGSVYSSLVSGAPEPGAWLLMIVGVFGIGVTMRRAQTTAAVHKRDALAA